MSKPFDHLMKNAALVSLGIVAVSALLIFSYIDSKDLTLSDIFNDETLYIGVRDSHFFDNVDDLTDRVSPSTSRYDTKVMTQNDVFAVVDNIQINSSIEDIIFIHEDRDDIRISYEREVPDTSTYVVNYKTRSTKNQIIIDVDLRTKGLYTDMDYDGLITIYLPKAYEGDNLIINSNVASHDMSLPNSVNDVDISVNFGSIDISVDQPLDSLKLSINAGDLYFKINEDVAKIDASVDTGELSFDVNNHVGNFSIENNVGEINGYLKNSPTVMDVLCNLGDVSLDFEQNINTLSAEMNLGDLTIDVDDDDNSTAFIDTDIVDYESVLKRTRNQSNANVFVEMNVGSVTIK